MSKFLSTSGIDRTLPDEFENEDWVGYLQGKYQEEAEKIISLYRKDNDNNIPKPNTPIVHKRMRG